MPSLKDLVGEKFNHLTVIDRAPEKGKRVMWRCLCDCGGGNYHPRRLPADWAYRFLRMCWLKKACRATKQAWESWHKGIWNLARD